MTDEVVCSVVLISVCFRGVLDDYKFHLSFEDISCRDYITKAFFDVSAKGSIVPVGKSTIPAEL